ncbi:MAG TPA: TylF/MycF/NovP-related O-methyltransferase [Thermodesulfobacteriota bacterium]
MMLIRTIPIKDFVDLTKIKLILSVRPYTQITYPRLSKLYEKATWIERKEIDGSFVECGVCNGGSAGLIASVAKRNKNRHIWLFDSWEGLPAPSQKDVSYLGTKGQKGMALGYEDKVRQLLFNKLKLENKNIHLVKGWFNEAIPPRKTEIGGIALLHLDCDWYESVKFCLEELCDSVVNGGFIFIDDYGHWEGCRRAVDEFIEGRNLKIKLIKIDYTGVYFQK